MRRWHEDRKIAEREWRKHRRTHVEMNIDRNKPDPFVVDCECDEQIGRFRKKDAFDCGRARCGVCHWHKKWGRTKSFREEISDIGFREELDDLDS